MSTTYATDLRARECSCGVVFAITERFERERRNDHRTFYCPNGCRRHFPQKNEAEELRDKLTRERHLREQEAARYTDLRSTLSSDLALATHQAKAYRHNRALLGAFWKGYEGRGCYLAADCPYESNRGGFRAAWFEGAGMDYEVTS